MKFAERVNQVPMPDIAGTYKGKKLLIVGCSRGVWDELEAMWPITRDVMCINDMICYYPGFFHHAYTNNEGRLDGYWANRRRQYKERYKNPDGTIREPLFHTLGRWETDHIRWPVTGNGTSSLAACHVGVYLGYDEILLCGCPMDDTGHFWQAPWEHMPKGREFSSQFRGGRQVWAYARDNVFKGKVKSVSGRTKDILDGIPCW